MEAEDVHTTPVLKDKQGDRPKVFHPGHIRYSCHRDGGSYSGCKLERFISETGPKETVHAIDKCNAFFAANENLSVMDMWVHEHEVVVLYTNFMDEEELEDFNMAAEELRGLMEKRREERRKAKLESLEGAEKDAAEQKRLAEVGKKCEQNHSKKAKKGKH